MNLQNVLWNGEEHKDKPDWSILIFCFSESEQRCRTFNCNKFYFWERGIWKINKQQCLRKILEIFQAPVPSYFSAPFQLPAIFFQQNVLNSTLNPKQLMPAGIINWPRNTQSKYAHDGLAAPVFLLAGKKRDAQKWWLTAEKWAMKALLEEAVLFNWNGQGEEKYEILHRAHCKKYNGKNKG